MEQLAIAYARRLAPAAIGGGANFYGEDALEAFVGDGRVCDAAIDFGDAVLLLEIQRGEVQAEIRYEGSVPRFLKHIDQAIVSKTEQLDSVARHILDDETPLTGISPQRDPRPRIYPVVVQGDGFAIEPISQGYIRKKVRDLGWLVHAKIETLSVIDTDELQMLVGLFESRGLSPTQLLQEWHASSHDLYSLRNYLLYVYPDRSPEDLRPKGAGPAWESLGEESSRALNCLRARLRTRSELGGRCGQPHAATSPGGADPSLSSAPGRGGPATGRAWHDMSPVRLAGW